MFWGVSTVARAVAVHDCKRTIKRVLRGCDREGNNPENGGNIGGRGGILMNEEARTQPAGSASRHINKILLI